MQKVCSRRFLVPKFDPELESRFAHHRRSRNVKGLRIAAPLVLMGAAFMSYVSSWEGCAMFYRITGWAAAVIMLTGLALVIVKCIPLWVFDSAFAGAAVILSLNFSLSFHRLEQMLGTTCSGQLLDKLDDEMYGPFSFATIVHATSMLMQPSQEAMLFVCVVCPAVYLLLLLRFGSHQATDYVARAYFIFTIFFFCVFQGSRHYENERRRKFLEITRHESNWTDLWNILKNAAVPVAVFGGEDKVVGGETTFESTKLCVNFWNESFQMYTEQKVDPGTAYNDVLSLAHESASQLKDAVLRAIDPARRQTTKQMLTCLVTPKGPVWFQLDIWPVTTAGCGPQAMVIGSDVSEFVSAHQSFLRRVQSEKDESPEAESVAEQEQDQGLFALHGVGETSDTGADSLAPRRAPLEASALMHREDGVLSQCTTALQVFFHRPMEGESLLQHVLAPDQKEILDVVGRVLQGSGSEQLAVHMFSRPLKGQPRKRGRFRRTFLKFEETGLGHSAHVRVVITPECGLYPVSEMGDDDSTISSKGGLGAKMGKSEPDVSHSFAGTPGEDSLRKSMECSGTESVDFGDQETNGQQAQGELLQSGALKMRMTAIKTQMFTFTCALPEMTQADSIGFLLAAIGEVEKPPWTNHYRPFSDWVCSRCGSNNENDDEECVVCAHERDRLRRAVCL